MIISNQVYRFTSIIVNMLDMLETDMGLAVKNLYRLFCNYSNARKRGSLVKLRLEHVTKCLDAVNAFVGAPQNEQSIKTPIETSDQQNSITESLEKYRSSTGERSPEKNLEDAILHLHNEYTNFVLVDENKCANLRKLSMVVAAVRYLEASNAYVEFRNSNSSDGVLCSS